jgi:hypothetical protein
MTKGELRRIKCTQPIKDPFPEYTSYNTNMSWWDHFCSLFGGILPMPEEPEHISIHKAYNMGYDRAFEIVEAYCNPDYRAVYEGEWIEEKE